MTATRRKEGAQPSLSAPCLVSTRRLCLREFAGLTKRAVRTKCSYLNQYK